MKIGIFDSGLGGLFILKGLLSNRALSKYDYVFLGDTKNLPYGNKSQKQIYKLAVKAIEYLFKQDCALVIVACNTASSQALRKIQQEWLPKSKYKDRKVLGVIRPTVESVIKSAKRIGVIGTNRTIDSKAYLREFKDFNPNLKIFQQATPLLVPLIESGSLIKIDEVLKHHLKQFKNIDTLILGCTHYCILKDKVRKLVGPKVKVISQDELLPEKLKSYLIRHKEITQKLSKNRQLQLNVTKLQNWKVGKFKLKLVKY